MGHNDRLRGTETIQQALKRMTGWSKADKARGLLELGYGVSEISKAVPMAYSQAHSIAKTVTPAVKITVAGDPKRGKTYIEPTAGVKGTRHAAAVKRSETRAAHATIERERANEAAGRPAGPSKKYPRVGKLRTGNLPHDIEVGPCANCGFDLAVRKSPHGFIFVHVNATAEEYLATIQFCQAVPEKLVK